MTAPATNFLDPTGVTLLAEVRTELSQALQLQTPMSTYSHEPRHTVPITEIPMVVASAKVALTVPFKTPNLPMVKISLNSFPPQYKTLDYTPVEYGQVFPPPASEKTI